MMKLFRKYNKQMLAVLMVMLMIVFLGGTALNSFFAPRDDRVIALSALGPISQTDVLRMDTVKKILGALEVNWQMPVQGMREPLTEHDWILLTREARKLGVGESFAMAKGSLVDWEGLNRQAMRMRINPQGILDATAEFSAIRQAAQTVAAAAAPSEAEVLTATRRALEKVKIRAVLLPGSAFVDPNLSPSTEELEAHFRTHREREAGPGLTFGYYVPNQVRVQFIKIDREKLAQQVRIANLEKLARTFYDDNKETHYVFKRPPKPKPEGEQPAEAPPELESPFLSWEESREKAIELVRKREATDAMDRIVNWLVPYMAEPWLDIERTKEGYKSAPPEVAQLTYYDTVLTKIPEAMAYPEAVSTGATEFFTQAGASKIPGVGPAFFQPDRGGSIESLADTAFRSQVVVPKVPTETGTSQGDYLSTYQTCRVPLTGPDGSRYLFRVIEGRPAHVAESLDEVRDKVIADLKTLKGYEAAKARGEAIMNCDPSLSLSDAFQQDDELVERLSAATVTAGLVDPPPFARSTGFDFTSDAASQHVYVGAGVGSVPLNVVEQCFALEDAPRKMKLAEVKDRVLVLVVEWIETTRGNTAEYEDMRKKLMPQMTGSRVQSAVADWLKPANIRARNQWRLATE